MRGQARPKAALGSLADIARNCFRGATIGVFFLCGRDGNTGRVVELSQAPAMTPARSEPWIEHADLLA
jgi:hypothetical protein